MTYTVKLARVANGFTQVQMAEKMGVSRDTYRKIELNPECATIAQAKLISSITGIPIENIFCVFKKNLPEAVTESRVDDLK